MEYPGKSHTYIHMHVFVIKAWWCYLQGKLSYQWHYDLTPDGRARLQANVRMSYVIIKTWDWSLMHPFMYDISFIVVDTNHSLTFTSDPTSAFLAHCFQAADTNTSNSRYRCWDTRGSLHFRLSLVIYSWSSQPCFVRIMSTANLARTCHRKSIDWIIKASLPARQPGAQSICTMTGYSIGVVLERLLYVSCYPTSSFSFHHCN